MRSSAAEPDLQVEVEDAIERLFGTLVVLETEDKAYLGCLRLRPDGRIAIHTGIVGAPPIVRLDEIEAVTAARDYPFVVGL